MTFRTRLTIAFVAIAVLPLAILGFGVRREMNARLNAKQVQGLDDVKRLITDRLNPTLYSDRTHLHMLAADLAADNRLRAAIMNPDSSSRGPLLDWAPKAMELAGFAVLQLQDSAGRILSSGQFRNDYDRLDPVVRFAFQDIFGILNARTPTGMVQALVSSDSFTMAGQEYVLTGGNLFDSTTVAQLYSGGGLSTHLVLNGAPTPPGSEKVLGFPYVDESNGADVTTANLILVPDLTAQHALQQGINRWLAATLGVTLLLSLLVATLLATRLAAPVTELARKTETLDLDRLHQTFHMDRSDEVGTLARTLDAMSARLRTSTARLRESERRATTGDLARQINHDIKNGLAPIRNVLRHMAQVAERNPEDLPTVFNERRATLESSVEYLDELSRNYARLSPGLRHGQSDVIALLREVAASITGANVSLDVPKVLPLVRADTVVLRRILENLTANAVDALDGKVGTITLGAEAVDETGGRVRITVSDTGRGMTREQLSHAFDDFYTTKPGGTGLGLSVVRRLVADLGGDLKVDTAPGQGSTFRLEIPVT